jgi:type I restriction enzyme R subunit
LASLSRNFSFLTKYSPELDQIAARAEQYFEPDPVTSLIWTRQFAEYLAQLVAARSGLFSDLGENQVNLLERLQSEGRYPLKIIKLFHEIRIVGNQAAHRRVGNHKTALDGLRKCRDLGIWFHLTFGDRSETFGSFEKPVTFGQEAEIAKLRAELAQARLEEQRAKEAALQAEQRIKTEAGDRAIWEQTAAEIESEKNRLAAQLALLQSQLEDAHTPRAQSSLSESSSAFEAREFRPRPRPAYDPFVPAISFEERFAERLGRLQENAYLMSSVEQERLIRVAELAAIFVD